MKRRKRKIKSEFRKLRFALGESYTDTCRIVIDPRQRQRQMLNTFVHELLHQIAPEWCESKISRAACSMTRVLWENNYRRITP